ncbi:hypothetical protein E1A91_A11G303400v1 [Gossypium mustelinum]|uniref:PHD-type domain-containing protein n=1 Tax=Gossypium mustelinum TaxID=34275 RepID=A0A5D2XCN5_GOSMU|nr:hypothetical protein E1A91_A11G303400v1 [Gossypium mustelinum]
MDIIIPPCNHTSHFITITLSETTENRCEECGGKISGTAFTCASCKVWKHISCADKLNRDLPFEIIHPLHLQHRLQLQWLYYGDFICDKCLYISTGLRYICFSCGFNLDLTCGSSVSGRLPKDQEPLRFKHGKKKTIFHYSHHHKLGFFKYRKVREEDYDCFWCEKHLLPSEVCYGCSFCNFYLHQVCSDKIPRTLSHSLHPNHPLRLTYTYENDYCNGCSKECDTYTPLYVCEMCSFRLDFDCAKLSPSLKLDCHHHLLTFFKDFNKNGEEEQYPYCQVCGKHCGGASVYRCVQCHFSLHLKCVVLSSATHKYHRHPLTMMELIKEDNSEQYYCDDCENERNPKDPVYYCQSCTFIAHIQCVLDQDKVASGTVPSSSPPPMENKALFVEQNEGKFFRPIIHPHQMYEVTEELKGEIYCSGCRLVLNGSSYFCKTCPDFYLHEKCAKFSYEIRHPFHSSHPLNLYTSNVWDHHLIACDECRDICDAFIYFCEQCDFKLDMKCAALTTHKIGVLEEKMTGRVTELHHFTHPHKLVLANCYESVYDIKCSFCEFVYSCEHCDFNLHVMCANSLRRPLKYKFHLNDLYYFGRNHISLFDSIWGKIFKCEVCGGSCRSEPFYCCLKCDIKFHLKCVCIPYTVKSKYHIHPLLLKDSFIEDDSGKYYCDFCEEERNPNDDKYYCEECNGQTIAHIECVLAEVEDNMEIRKNIHEERFRKEIIEAEIIAILENLIARFMKLFSNKCKPPIEEVIQAGVVPRFVDLLSSPSDYVREQAVLALGNIAAVSLTCRDLVLGYGALLPLLALLNEPVSRSMLRNATWTLSRFCKPPFDQVKLVLPTLGRLIHSKDEVVLAKACWALSYLFDGTNDKIQAVIESGVLGRLVELLMHPSPSVITPTLYTVKHIVTGDDVQIQAIIEATIIAPLVHLLQNAEFDIKKQAGKAISKATSGGTHDQIRYKNGYLY